MAGLTEQQNLLIRISTDASSAVKGFGQLKGSVDSLGSTVMKVAGAIGAAFAFRDVINSTQAWANQLDNLHDTLGLSGDEAAKWNYQARLVGTTADDVATAFGQLTNKIGNSLPAIQQGTSDFDKWGIKVLDSNNSLMGATAILDQVREKVNALGPGLGARQLEMDLFGRSGGKLHDFIMFSNEELERMAQDLRALDLPTNAAEMEAYNRESNRLGFIFDSIKIKLGSALLPVLLAAGRGLASLSGYVKVLGEALRYPLSIIKEVIDKFGTFISKIKDQGFVVSVVDLAGELKDILLRVLSDIGAKLDSLGPLGTIAKDALLAVGALHVISALAGVVEKVVAIGAGLRSLPARTVLAVDVVLVGIAVWEVAQTVALIADNWELVRRAQRQGLLESQGPLGFMLDLAVRIGDAWATVTEWLRGIPGVVDIARGAWEHFLGLLAGAAFDIPILGGLLGVINTVVDAINVARSAWEALQRAMGQTPPAGAVPPTYQPPPPGSIPPGGFAGPSQLPPVSTLPISEQQAYLRRLFPQNFGSGGGPEFSAADGGITTRDAIGLVHANEAIIPLDRAGGMGNTYITVNVGSVDDHRRIKELTDAISQELMGRIGSRRAVAF